VFLGMLAGEAAIFWTFLRGTFPISGNNVIGCVVVVTVALTLTWLAPATFAKSGSPPAQ